jgi:hypothetical protein
MITEQDLQNERLIGVLALCAGIALLVACFTQSGTDALSQEIAKKNDVIAAMRQDHAVAITNLRAAVFQCEGREISPETLKRNYTVYIGNHREWADLALQQALACERLAYDNQ